MVTGNGFGFAVVSPDSATLTKFYAHPYSFARPDPLHPMSEGVETANYIKHLGWSGSPEKGAVVEYVDDSQVIHTHTTAGDGLFFMPFGLRQSVVVIRWDPASTESHGAHWTVEWNRPVQSRKVVRMFGADMQLLKFDGMEESLLLIPLDPGRTKAEVALEDLAGSRSWALISLDAENDMRSAVEAFREWRGDLAVQALAKREREEVERWRVKPSRQLEGNELHVWRQSEMVLRMAQSREPNRPGRYNNGLIVACLPDGSFSMPWVRDMAYAAVALIRMGHQDEARAAVLAYFNARPTGKMKQEVHDADYQVSVVRYFGDGSEEPFFTMEGNTNIEFDNWGLALWVLGEYEKHYRDADLLRAETYRGPLYASAKDYIVRALLANTEKYVDGLIVTADTSIWEERQKDQKHFAFSTATAIVGLQSFAEIAGHSGDEQTQSDLLKHVALLKKGFDTAFIRGGKLHGTLEEGVKNDIDGALLSVINFGIVTNPAIVRDTVERMELLKVASGGYRRVRGTFTDPAIYEYWYEQEEFLFVDFNMAEVYRLRGKKEEAAAIVKRIVDKAAADHNVIPEMYVAVDCKLFHGAIGDPTGATPMVGYGAGVYILDAVQH